MAYTPKTWSLNDTVLPADANKWEQELSILDKRELVADMSVYVATTGSDTTGTGSSTAPYKTITYALSTIPKNLGDHTATVNVADGTYAEDVKASGFYTGFLTIRSSVENSFNANCVVQSLAVWTCFANVKLQGITVAEETNKNAIHIVNSHTVDVYYVRSLKENPTTSCVVCVKSYVSIAYCELSNHLRAVYATEGSTVFLDNSTGVGDILNLAGSIVTSRNSSFIGSTTVNPGGILVSPYGASIGTLQQDTTLYVATTGSDSAGDGTSAKPYKTIQYALDSLPRDLGGYRAFIYVAGGTYDDNLLFLGVGNSGTLTIVLEGNVTTNNIYLEHSSVIFNSPSGVTSNTLSTKYVLATNDSSIYAYANVFITTTGYYQDGNKRQSIFIIRNSKAYFSGGTNITGNDGVGVAVSNLSNAYFYSISGSGLAVGLDVSSLSQITVGNNTLSATLPTAIYAGGQIINSNGTQISNIISSGLSCTWGNIGGGYIRHGNLNGVAMVTVQIHLSVTAPLSVGSTYAVNGLPQSFVNLCVAASPQEYISNCWLDTIGRINLVPRINYIVGQSIAFNCTYLTTS